MSKQLPQHERDVLLVGYLEDKLRGAFPQVRFTHTIIDAYPDIRIEWHGDASADEIAACANAHNPGGLRLQVERITMRMMRLEIVIYGDNVSTVIGALTAQGFTVDPVFKVLEDLGEIETDIVAWCVSDRVDFMSWVQSIIKGYGDVSCAGPREAEAAQ